MSARKSTYALAVGMGIIAGLRSMSAPALLSHHLVRRPHRARGMASRLLSSRASSGVFTLLAAGEMAADKVPGMPARTDPPALAGRALMCALTGAAVAEWHGGRSVAPAALVGAAAAVAASFLALELRTAAGRSFGVPDPVVAVIEDGIVLAAGSQLADAV